MVKVKILKRGTQWLVGDVVEVERNDAHTLIDTGVAKLFTEYSNKILEPERPKWKGYKVK